jgi:chromosome segregation ATPase
MSENLEKINSLEKELSDLVDRKKDLQKQLAPLLKGQTECEDRITKIQMEIKRLEKNRSVIILEALRFIENYGHKISLGRNYLKKLVNVEYDEFSYENLIKIFEIVLPMVEKENALAVIGFEEKMKVITILEEDAQSACTYVLDLGKNKLLPLYEFVPSKEGYKREKTKNGTLLAQYKPTLLENIAQIEREDLMYY